MMNFVIFYFSGTGNTWWSSGQLKKELEAAGNSVDMYSLENPKIQKTESAKRIIQSADHVIIGYPTYGSDLPRNMKAFIDNLPEVKDNKKLSAFCTHASFTGNGNIYSKDKIEAKGYNFMQSFQLSLTTNFNVAMFPFSLSKPAAGKKLEKKKRKASKKIQKLSMFIIENKEYFDGNRLYQIVLGNIQRHFFQKFESKFSKRFKFFKNKCVKCNLCIEHCPTNNLYFNESGELQNRNKCILCFRCYNFCPDKAIFFGKKVKHPDNCIRYKGPVKNLKISDIKK